MSDQVQSGKGRRVGVIIVALCGVLALGGWVVQWRATTRLQQENQALLAAQRVMGEQLEAATEVSQQQPAVVPAPDERERTELLRLRNEVRQLRERAAETKGSAGSPQPGAQRPPPTGPAADPGVVQESLASAVANYGPRVDLTPEWRGMEPFATNKYARALERFTNANNHIEKFAALGDVAKLSFAFGRAEDARASATELLALAEKYKGEGWSKGSRGQAVHDGNVVLGRMALEQGSVEDAKRHLLEAGTTDGSPVLGSFGPNMSLARELLERGERAAVLQYFEQCGKFWRTETLKQWTAEVNAGRMPNFGANLIY